MGLDASVPCSCFAHGLAKPCPVAITLEEGRPWPTSDDDYAAFSAWRECACAHPNMEALDERIGNWASVRALQDALRNVGAAVATLFAQLPDANGGLVDAATARVCLAELATFRRSLKRATVRLVNATTGATVYDYIAAYEGQFLWSRDGDVGFDANGIYIRDRETRKVRFQARRVIATPAAEGCTLRDVVTGISARCGWKHDAETAYEVVEHVETAADHTRTLSALEHVFRAAIEHDTCVMWC